MPKPQLKPMSNHIIIEVEDRETHSKGGLILPDIVDRSFQDNFSTGIVRGVGPGKRSKKTGERLPMQVQVGDRVLFNDHTANREISDAPRTIICEQETIFAVLG